MKDIRYLHVHFLIHTTNIFLFIINYHCATLRTSYLDMKSLVSIKQRILHHKSVISGQKLKTVISAPHITTLKFGDIGCATHCGQSLNFYVQTIQKNNLGQAWLVKVADAHTLCIFVLRVGCL